MSTLKLKVRSAAEEMPYDAWFEASTTPSQLLTKEVWFRVVAADHLESPRASKSWSGDIAAAYVSEEDFRKLETLRVKVEHLQVAEHGFPATLCGAG